MPSTSETEVVNRALRDLPHDSDSHDAASSSMHTGSLSRVVETGGHKGNPVRCIICGMEFHSSEAWGYHHSWCIKRNSVTGALGFAKKKREMSCDSRPTNSIGSTHEDGPAVCKMHLQPSNESGRPASVDNEETEEMANDRSDMKRTNTPAM